MHVFQSFHAFSTRHGWRFANRISRCLLIAIALLGSAHAEPRDRAEQFGYIHLNDSHRPALSYALVRLESGTVFSGHSDDLKTLRTYRRLHKGSYLWFRDGDKQYVIDDAASVAKLTELWQATTPIEQQMQPLEEEMEKYAREMEDLAFDREDLLDDRHVDVDFHAKMQKLDESTEAISSKMDLVSEKIDTLSKQIEQLSQTANEQTMALIDEALTKGTAQPIET